MERTDKAQWTSTWIVASFLSSFELSALRTLLLRETRLVTFPPTLIPARWILIWFVVLLMVRI